MTETAPNLKLLSERETFEEMIAGCEYEKTIYPSGKVEITICNTYYEYLTLEFSAEGKFLSVF